MRFWNHEVLLNLDSILSELGGKVTPLHPPLHLRGEYWEVSLRFRSVYPLNTQMNLIRKAGLAIHRNLRVHFYQEIGGEDLNHICKEQTGDFEMVNRTLSDFLLILPDFIAFDTYHIRVIRTKKCLTKIFSFV